RGPTLYNPLVDWTSAKNRQKTVLDAMIRDGDITAAAAAKAFAEDLSPPTHMFYPSNSVAAPAFVSYVTGLLIKQFGRDQTYTGGLRVVTTLNPQIQNIGQQAVTQNINRLRYRNITQGALVALDPTSGAIIAMVGSPVGTMARNMGAPPYVPHGVDANGYPIYTNDDPLNIYGPSLTLGGYGETPLQMATGASVLATQGLLRQPYAINLVTRGDQLVYMHGLDPGKRVLDARVAFIMQSIMSNDN